jgi:sulfatase maturation enzyme AslB (radical SAM superfamily)
VVKDPFNLPTQYMYKLKSMPRGSDIKTSITNTCQAPYKTAVIDFNSNCLICGLCDGWLPIPVGKVSDFESLEQLWNNPTAHILQKDIDDKKFTWCAVENCGIQQVDVVPRDYQLAINIDESCNLSCPSCRREKIMHTDGPVVKKKIQDVERIMQWLEKFDKKINIILSGNGDPLASSIIRPLIKNYSPKSTQTFTLFTNGLLIKKQLADSKILPNVTDFWISVDAGSADVYQKIRRGGNWSVLLENFKFLQEHGYNSCVRLNYAVQQSNFRDIDRFIDLCQHYGFRGLIHQLDDWGTWSNEVSAEPDIWTIKNGTFQDHNVLSKTHPEHALCCDVIARAAKYANPNILITNRLLSLVGLV